jgi:putative sigma-54 modulation protein
MEKIYITSRNVEVTPEMKSYIEKRLKKMERLSDKINKAEVIIEEQRGRFKCEFLLDVNRKFLKAQSISNDFFYAIDELKDKMERQLKKFEEKLKRRKR